MTPTTHTESDKGVEGKVIRLIEADFPNNIADVIIWEGNVGYRCSMSLRLLMAMVKLEHKVTWSFYPPGYSRHRGRT